MKNCIIILNYNSKDIVVNLVNTLLNYVCIDYICIVDNCSQNKEFEYFVHIFGKNRKCFLVKTQFNGGYSYGNNYGIKHMENYNFGIELFYICNPDIILNEHMFIEFEFVLKNNNSIGAITCLRTDKNGKFNQKQFGNVPTIKDELAKSFVLFRKLSKKNIVWNLKDNNQHYYNVQILSGSFFGVTAKALKEINYFDENTFLYYEENITFKKILNCGFSCVILTNCQYVHNHVISRQTNIKKKIQNYGQYLKSKKYYFDNYLSKNTILRVINNILLIYDFCSYCFVCFVKKCFNIKDSNNVY